LGIGCWARSCARPGCFLNLTWAIALILRARARVLVAVEVHPISALDRRVVAKHFSLINWPLHAPLWMVNHRPVSYGIRISNHHVG
jgi:hypothetical protein